MKNTDDFLTVEIVSPSGASAGVACDSVHINISDNQRGYNGGDYEIRKGHAPSVFLVSGGITTARKNGKNVLSVRTGDGFATVKNNTVCIVVNKSE